MTFFSTTPLLQGTPLRLSSLVCLLFFLLSGTAGTSTNPKINPVTTNAETTTQSDCGDLNIQNNGQGSALNAAARNGHREILRILLDAGADINAQTNGQGSALNAAARNGQMDIVKFLVEKGADVNVRSNGQGSPLNAAMRNNNTEIAGYLLKQGAH